MIVPICDYLINSADTYFLDLANQLNNNYDNVVVCHLDDVENHIHEHDTIFCIRGSGMEKSFLYKNKKVIVQFDDIHYFTEHSRKARVSIFDRADYILLPYYKQFINMSEYSQFHKKAIWLPYHVSNIVQEIGDIDWNNKMNKALLTGNISEPYSFRKLIADENSDVINILEHPGYKSIKKHDIIKKKYFEKISQYKGGIVTSADENFKGFNLNYTLMKYFEIPACGTVPFLDYTEDLLELGFIDNENCIMINKNDYLNKIKKHIDNITVAINAKKFMLEKHTFRNRMKLLEIIFN